jgi:hypothetical protein
MPPGRNAKRRTVVCQDRHPCARAADIDCALGAGPGGLSSLRAIAAGLEERGIPAARGGKWSAVQVARVLEAAAVPFGESVAAV